MKIFNIVNRCTNPECAGWPDYGGRGITVHPEWLADEGAFLRYIVSLPGWDDRRLTLDRIENDRGYEPGNLRWTTPSKQARNRRTTRWVEFRGERMSLVEFWERFTPRFQRRNLHYYHVKLGRSLESLVQLHDKRYGAKT